MREVVPGLFVGDDSDCCIGSEGMAVVHACKIHCHQLAVGYHGSLPDNHPNYLYLDDGYNLYLNMIDPHVPLFRIETFWVFLGFYGRHHRQRSVLIHCNQGMSRSPSLAMLALACLGEINTDSYELAMSDFSELCECEPGKGIACFMSENWAELIGLSPAP